MKAGEADSRNTGIFIPLMGGLLLLVILFALGVFVLPIAPDPRPLKPTAVPAMTTYWDKWKWERNARRIREQFERELQREKEVGVPQK